MGSFRQCKISLGSWRLCDLGESSLMRLWNNFNLRKCYFMKMEFGKVLFHGVLDLAAMGRKFGQQVEFIFSNRLLNINTNRFNSSNK